MFENVVPRILGWVPLSWRRAIIGRSDHPSRIATLVHNLLNRMRPTESQVFDCQGVLKGFRVSVDWSRFRSFIYGTWEPEVTNAVIAIVSPGMTVIDIGAHIGYYTLLFAKCVGPAGRVVAFEPLPANVGLLRRNIELNQLHSVEIFPQAVFSHIGEVIVTIPDDSRNSGDASACYVRGAQQLSVPAITLDSFCASKSFRPDIIKMDVEGAEYDVLLGTQQTITMCHPKMLIELHHFDGDRSSHPVPGLLSSWGYRVEWLEQAQLTSHILATPVLGSFLKSDSGHHGTA
jgi:FkbM family methyltransferase